MIDRPERSDVPDSADRPAQTGGLVFVVNDGAGSGRAGRRWDAMCRRRAVSGEVIRAASPAMADAALDAVLDGGVRRIVAAGGDGTFHQLVNAVMKHGLAGRVELGVIPLGTGSDLARTLQLPRRIDDALQLAASAPVRAMDLLAVTFNDTVRYAANVASFGLSAAVADDVQRRTRRRPWSYLHAAIRQLRRGEPQSISASCDGEAWYEGRAWFVAAANGPRFGSGMRIAPRARVDDGNMDCIVITGSGMLRLLRQMPRLYTGHALTAPDVQWRTARAMSIRGPATGWQAELDGEPYPPCTGGFEVTLLPGAIRIAA